MATPDTGPRRLIHIHLGHDGGAERFFVRLVKALDRRGVEQMAFVRPRRSWRDDIAPHCRVRESRFSRSLLKRGFMRARIALAAKLTGSQAAIAWMAPSARWLPAPRPGLATFTRLGDFPDHLKAFKTTGAIIGNTPEVVRRCVAMGWPAERTHMISNFVPVKRSEPADRAGLGVPEDAFLVLALGRFVHRKGLDVAIRAVADAPTVHLWIAGDGELRADLERLAADLCVSGRVRFLGWQHEPAPFIAAADAVVCPSREEPLGNVVLEAWAYGKPVVATASEGPSWLITDGVDGILTPIDDVGGVAAGIRALAADRDLAARLAAGGQATLATRFSEDAIADDYIRLLFGPTAAEAP